MLIPLCKRESVLLTAVFTVRSIEYFCIGANIHTLQQRCNLQMCVRKNGHTVSPSKRFVLILTETVWA